MHEIDYTTMSDRWIHQSVPAKSFREEKDGTYSTFAHAHRLRAPFVADGTLELEETRMIA